MKKEMYEAPEMDVVEFESEDVITTSDECGLLDAQGGWGQGCIGVTWCPQDV